MEAVENTESAAGAKPAKDVKLKKYRCNTKCFWTGSLYYVGDTIDVPENVKVPEHFTEIK